MNGNNVSFACEDIARVNVMRLHVSFDVKLGLDGIQNRKSKRLTIISINKRFQLRVCTLKNTASYLGTLDRRYVIDCKCSAWAWSIDAQISRIAVFGPRHRKERACNMHQDTASMQVGAVGL